MNKYKQHQQLIKRFKVLAQNELRGVRVFDNTVGLFYTKNMIPIKAGIKGMADCYMFIPSEKGIILINLEFKTGKAKQTKEQKNWQRFITSINGSYIIVRDEYVAVKEIKELLIEREIV